MPQAQKLFGLAISPLTTAYIQATITTSFLQFSSTRSDNMPASNGSTNGHTNGHTSGDVQSVLSTQPPVNVSPTCTIQLPMTHRGHGPALILLVPKDTNLSTSDKTLDPPPLQKWAEEGYVVTQVKVDDDETKFQECLQEGIDSLDQIPERDSAAQIGLIGKHLIRVFNDTATLTTIISIQHLLHSVYVESD